MVNPIATTVGGVFPLTHQANGSYALVLVGDHSVNTPNVLSNLATLFNCNKMVITSKSVCDYPMSSFSNNGALSPVITVTKEMKIPSLNGNFGEYHMLICDGNKYTFKERDGLYTIFIMKEGLKKECNSNNIIFPGRYGKKKKKELYTILTKERKMSLPKFSIFDGLTKLDGKESVILVNSNGVYKFTLGNRCFNVIYSEAELPPIDFMTLIRETDNRYKHYHIVGKRGSGKSYNCFSLMKSLEPHYDRCMIIYPCEEIQQFYTPKTKDMNYTILYKFNKKEVLNFIKTSGNSTSLLVLDGCIGCKKDIKRFFEVLVENRDIHKLHVISTVQYVLRFNIEEPDLVVLCEESFVANLKRMYEIHGQMYHTFDEFRTQMLNNTKDFNALSIVNNEHSTKAMHFKPSYSICPIPLLKVLKKYERITIDETEETENTVENPKIVEKRVQPINVEEIMKEKSWDDIDKIYTSMIFGTMCQCIDVMLKHAQTVDRIWNTDEAHIFHSHIKQKHSYKLKVLERFNYHFHDINIGEIGSLLDFKTKQLEECVKSKKDKEYTHVIIFLDRITVKSLLEYSEFKELLFNGRHYNLIVTIINPIYHKFSKDMCKWFDVVISCHTPKQNLQKMLHSSYYGSIISIKLFQKIMNETESSQALMFNKNMKGNVYDEIKLLPISQPEKMKVLQKNNEFVIKRNDPKKISIRVLTELI